MNLAITEKRPQGRPGGCAGIFFLLFDWNRRLAKKKLFYRKRLPPVRAANKFGGDEKKPMAKLQLIAEENRGGFPCSKKSEADEDVGRGMGAPGLVARLMGLESVPVVGHEKPRKALDSDIFHGGNESGDYSRLDQDLCREVSEQGKLESRPQKLQKTGGLMEQRPAILTADVVLKDSIARSRKKQDKPSSSMKSPKLLSRSNQARLMQAATKILEPSLRSPSRSRLAIDYMGSSEPESARYEASTSRGRSKEPSSDLVIGSCRSCGGVVEVSKIGNIKEPLTTLFDSSAFCNPPPFQNGAKDKFFYKPASPARQAKANVQGKNQDLIERKHHIVSDQSECNSKPEYINVSLRKFEFPISRDNVVNGAKLCTRKQLSKDSSDSVGLKKNLKNSPCLKLSSEVSSSDNGRIKRHDWETNIARKRRSSCNANTVYGNQSNQVSMKQRSICSPIINKNGAKNESRKRAGSRNAGICSDAFTPKGRLLGGSLMFSKTTVTQNQDFDIKNQKFQDGSLQSCTTSMASDCDHLSPISIFDASFSNESCSVGSLDDSLDIKGSTTVIENIDVRSKTRSLGLDIDLLDSATSSNVNKSLISSFNSCFQMTKSHRVHIHQCESLANAELLLQNILLFDTDRASHSSSNDFFLGILSMILNSFFASPEAKKWNQLNNCMFDCLIESLDSRFNHFFSAGYKTCLKMPLFFEKDQLLNEIYEEIGRWVNGGKVWDEFIEEEISYSTVRWSCQAEAFSAGIEIETSVLEALVCEVVEDLW
ncbi:hypothetical protein AXF42_Ash014138 [Apostasia shenzhenica]|uniref:DUF3741 domain-containing protein n=1 Tax=Apostasia shenzhenica TaxID=1088818 RepID=A0A2I0A134_9ASPA|nr:hypothetical protein AXF42_Ash014138 [Apostasia shenzhenica]